MTEVCPGLLGVRGVVRHSAAALDPQFAILIHLPGHVLTTGAAGNGRVNKITGGVGDVVLYCERLGVGTLGNVQDNLGGIGERSLVNARNTLRDIHIGQRKAVTQCICRNIGYRLRQNNFYELGVVEEGENSKSLQLAALFKFYSSGILAVCKGIVANGCDILAEHNFSNVATATCPRLLGMRGVIGHRAGAADLQRTVRVERPVDAIAELTAFNGNNHTFTEFVLQVVVNCIGMSDRTLCNL